MLKSLMLLLGLISTTLYPGASLAQSNGQVEAQEAIDHVNDRSCRANPGNCQRHPDANRLKGRLSTDAAYKLCNAGYGKGRSEGFVMCVYYLSE